MDGFHDKAHYFIFTDDSLPTPEKISEIKERLAKHETWLQTLGREGARFRANRENFTGVDFSHRKLSGAEFTECKFDKAMLNDCEFLDLKDSGPNTVFFNCDLKDSIFDASRFSACIISVVRASGCSFYGASLENVSIIGNVRSYEDDDDVINDFRHCTISNTSVTNFNFYGALFDKCSLYMAKFSNCVFNKVDFSKALPASSLFFEGCKMSRVSFYDLVIEGSVFNKCNLARANFDRVKAKGSKFASSVLSYAKFANSDVSESVWGGSAVDYADFTGASLHHGEARLCDFTSTDFRNAQLYSLDLSGSTLRGAIIDSSTNINLTNFTGCTWLTGEICKAESIGRCIFK